MEPVLGIDFGTTYSAMAWCDPNTGRAEVLLNAEGEPKTPSVVYFGASEVVVGKPALHVLEDAEESRRVVFSCKRYLQSNAVLALPGRRVTMVEAAAAILAKLKRDAEELHFHAPVRRAVVTCPAAFGEVERERIEAAARQAGFAEVTLLEEPVAAALAYARHGLQVGQHILVYDLGGGTFDLAVLLREGESGFRLALEPRGLPTCGGDDFDRALYDYLDERLRAALNLTAAAEFDLNRLLPCRECKESLSHLPSSLFSVYVAGQRFQERVERRTFEDLIRDRLEDTIRLTQDLVADAARRGQPVDTVVLIGGSSRIPLVEAQLAKVLPVKLHKFQQRDVAVALGAAYYAQVQWNPTPKPQPLPEPQPNQPSKTAEDEFTRQLDAILGVSKELASVANAVSSTNDELASQLSAITGSLSLVNIKLEEGILSILRDFSPQEDFFVSSEIPTRKLTNACASCNIPRNERVLGLIDCTVFGSAKDALIFGAKGIYYRHINCTPTIGNLPYVDFPHCNFKIVGDSRGILLTPQLIFSLAGSNVSEHRVIDMLNAIRKLIMDTRKLADSK